MLTYDIRKTKGQSLYGQLYQCIRCDIESGKIAAGEKLPSKRAFAEHLGVSIITVEGAYTQLVAEGYVTAKPRCGYFAADLTQGIPLLHADPKSRPASAAIPRRSEPAIPFAEKQASTAVVDLSGASSIRERLPYKAWARCVREVLSNESESTLISASEASGSYELRHAISCYLHGFRGMEVDPGQVIVGAGSQTLYALIIQLLGRKSHFAIENPGYTRLARIYRANDVELSFVEMDNEGVSLKCLENSGANVLHCTPSHQYPLGLVTSAPRRKQLLKWAENPSSTLHNQRKYIIEDDYDCEFRMSGRPIPSLCSVDDGEHVIYTNTFTKSLGSSFRIAYAVLPPHLAERFHQTLDFYTCTVGAIEQLALARFITSGEYERHVNRQRTHYRHVQEALIGGLRTSSCASKLRYSHVGAGLHFVLDVDCLYGESEFAARLLKEGVRVIPVSACRMEKITLDDADTHPNPKLPKSRIGKTGRERDGFSHCQIAISLTGINESNIADIVHAFERVLA